MSGAPPALALPGPALEALELVDAEFAEASVPLSLSPAPHPAEAFRKGSSAGTALRRRAVPGRRARSRPDRPVRIEFPQRDVIRHAARIGINIGYARVSTEVGSLPERRWRKPRNPLA
jgi:hypothetical protein